MDFSTLTPLLYSLGVPGFFASRAFTPAFATAIILRYGEHLPFLGSIEFLKATGNEPTWFTSNWTILILGILALAELLATKVPEAEELLGEVHKYAKSGMSLLTSLGILSAGDTDFINTTISQANVFDTLWATAVAGGTFFLTSVRNGSLDLLIQADPDDDLSIRSLISWFEDIWGSVGIYFLILYPLFMIGLIAIIIGLIGLARKYATYREEKSKIACPNCSTLIYASAFCCPQCAHLNPTPNAIGFLGQTKPYPSKDPLFHPETLASKKRCPACATRLPERSVRQACPQCKLQPFADKAFGDRYISMIHRRIPKVLSISLLFSLVPIIGLIPGVIYYRLTLLAPFRQYIPITQGFFLKWVLRIVFLLLITLQIIPGLGAVVVPLMALLSYLLYRNAFTSQIAQLGSA